MGGDGDPLADRRQRAREAFWDELPNLMGEKSPTHDPYEPLRSSLHSAIETATRVRITHDVFMAFIEGPADIAGALAAAFRAAGFEVED